MRVKAIVMVEPSGQRLHDGRGVGLRIDGDVIALERAHESLGHAIGLWTFDRRRQRQEADVFRKAACFHRRVTGSIVRQPFDRGRQTIDLPETLLDNGDGAAVPSKSLSSDENQS